MKVGSIVECIDNSNFYYVNYPKPKMKQPYTVAQIVTGYVMNDDGSDSDKIGTGIVIEELAAGIAYEIERFRELLPPMEIQSALDECEPILIEL